jgi:Flp pilus assembly protein TadD/SAM-dependent methyltransferase
MTEDLRALLSRASAELRAGRPESAERLYRRALALDPGNAEAMHFRGLALAHGGRAADGIEAMKRSITLDPAQPMYALNTALVLSEAGAHGEAEAVLADAIARAPGAAALHNALGAVLQRHGAWNAARDALERAVALAPGDDTAHNNLGYVLLECGDLDGALRRLGEALRLNPSNAMARNNLGNALLARGDVAGAEASYRRALALAPQFAGAHYNLGKLLRDHGAADDALASLRTCLALSPQDPGAWQVFADTLAGVRFTAPDPALEDDLAACLRREDVEPTGLTLAAFSLLRTDPGFEALLEATEPALEQGLGAARRPLFLLLLENAIVPDPRFERLVARLRREVLMRAADDPGRAGPEETRLACALAQQCFLTEYVTGETPAETQALDRLAAAREEFALAAYAAYRPLGTLPAAADLAPAAADGPFGRLVRRQLTEPAEERRLRGTLAALTGSEDPVSRAVRAQYEENPYPRWHRAPAFVGAYPLGVRLRTLFPRLAAEDIDTGDAPSVLIAGCGTGRHAAITARQQPNARILAVDLSEASLAFAMRRFAELGIGNVRFARADLLQLGRLEERFDLIECAGVLHHLDDPLAGWRVLLGLLRPRGFMNLALYSETGRAAIVAARRFIEERAFAATPSGMRAVRAAIVALPESAPAHAVLDSVDFYSMSGCRDLLFHAKEHRYTPARIEAALRELDLEFLGFELDARTRRAYAGRFPGDPEGTDLGNWARFEAERPDTFAAMYPFWVRRRARG